MNKLLLINLFDENLNWSNLWSDIRFIVDKGTAGMVSPYYQYALRPNRGFEAETWAWFFAAYYNELPDYTICLHVIHYHFISFVFFILPWHYICPAWPDRLSISNIR